MSHRVLFCNAAPDVVTAVSAVSLTADVRELWAHTSLSPSLHCGRTVKAAAEEQTDSRLLHVFLLDRRGHFITQDLLFSERTYTRISQPAGESGGRRTFGRVIDWLIYVWYIYFNLIPLTLEDAPDCRARMGPLLPFIVLCVSAAVPHHVQGKRKSGLSLTFSDQYLLIGTLVK